MIRLLRGLNLQVYDIMQEFCHRWRVSSGQNLIGKKKRKKNVKSVVNLIESSLKLIELIILNNFSSKVR